MHDIAPAKVNLTLRVLGRRADGYHALESLVTFAGVGDRVKLAVGAPEAVSMSGPFAVGIDGENLLSRVLVEVAERAPKLRLGAVHLVKNLPVAAGLGGGSSDAATLIRLIQQANAGDPDLARVDWQELAPRLGADVPVCLARKPTLMWGIGEKLTALPDVAGAPRAMPAVLVNPRLPLATRDVFKALAAGPLSDNPKAPEVPHLRSLGDMAAYMRAVGNDLERPALALLPIIADVKAALAAQAGCLHAALSGSGPTCFALYGSADAATAAAAAITCAHPGWWVVATTLDFPG
jgi:4-diphosphocytidyl-2-C-methyl-D-erythritol kinase